MQKESKMLGAIMLYQKSKQGSSMQTLMVLQFKNLVDIFVFEEHDKGQKVQAQMLLNVHNYHQPFTYARLQNLQSGIWASNMH